MSLDDVEVQMKHYIDSLEEFREALFKRQLQWFELVEKQLDLMTPEKRREIAPYISEFNEDLAQLNTLVPNISEPLNHRLVLLRRYLNDD
ncbi:hypothetical protein LRP49_04460 [Enterovibrio sp. ZSDZ35]|uniref:Flagellar protein FliT n=1 Tax=Enterovibrio qingdaonensis TaxID=2899818 RepID=A0ABT5QHJ2_9GAMM|nr:hypothetical protein [Enterovibrio sp. ZSDZ35]MDD1780447.1 hypothetical protein [Enterovibrio sp. ZSDZ35]